MSDCKYFSANYTLLGASGLLVLMCIVDLLFDDEGSKFVKLLIENYLLFIPFVIFSLLYGLTYNIINQDGLKRTTFFGGYTIRSIEWKKIKHFTQVDEEWNGSYSTYHDDAIWFIGHDDTLYFIIVAKNKTQIQEIIKKVSALKENFGKILKYNNPNLTIIRVRKVRYDKVKN
tara:strand:- start:13 stop:531 length:519 start_codon:yes stop_codon:yes gene_type:complete